MAKHLDETRIARENYIHDVVALLEQNLVEENIKQARALIKINGGDEKLLRANIASNQLTRETAVLYIEYLRRNAALIEAENRKAQKTLATAMNTYDTVKLSSDVAALMNTVRRAAARRDGPGREQERRIEPVFPVTRLRRREDGHFAGG